MQRNRLIIFGCYAMALILFSSAAAFLVFGSNRGLGIFLLIGATISSRILLLNIAGQYQIRPSSRKTADTSDSFRDSPEKMN